ncbi:MAG: hypothetical protein KGJ89_05165 [Patescibacteria group bacterium]|nr:hypothetical protein [Patescibacteria group bacterium]MDE2227312.1 hypothetical protein [Patescibacteria group bacterium]
MTKRISIKVDPKRVVEIEIPSRVRVFTSKDKSGQEVKSAAFPLVFGGGGTGVVILTKLTTDPHWQPVDDVKRIMVEMQEKPQNE